MSAFLTPGEVPKPTTSVRSRHSGSYGGLGGDPFEDPPAIAAAGVGNRGSSGSLPSVPEHDETDDYGYKKEALMGGAAGAAGATAMRPHRHSLGEGRYSNDATNVHPDCRRHSAAAGESALSPLNPAHRNHSNSDPGAFASPYDAEGSLAPGNSIRRKPIASPVNDGTGEIPVGYAGSEARDSWKASYPPFPRGGQNQPVRQNNWPFHRDAGNGSSGSSSNSGNNGGYWRAERPNYDRYERVDYEDV